MAKFVLRTRNLFLCLLCGIYLFAFCSLYTQVQGLYGEKGILPAHTQLSNIENPAECFFQKKSLICFSHLIGLNVVYMMELLALTGTILAFIGFVWRSWNNSLFFFSLWIIYLSLYKVGQTFLWFQWDTLMLEMGFLAIFVAPIRLNYKQKYHPKDIVTMWLVKWLLFRLTFSSGVVKLQSGCPTWWGLSALDIHYESQCIPTPLSWFAHQFPSWWNKLCVVATFIILIPIPFMFYSPVRNHRLFAFKAQVLLQVLIILTGNYNFFNLATIALCFSLIDDVDLGYKREIEKLPGAMASLKPAIGKLFKWFGYGALMYGSCVYFGLQLSSTGIVESEITFSKNQFEMWVHSAVPLCVTIGSLSLLFTVAEALTISLLEIRGTMQKLSSFSVTLVYSLIALFLFGNSLVPFTSIDASSRDKVWPAFKQWYQQTGDFELSSSYGLFRQMTGINGRSEVILEGSNSMEGPWIPYDFKYKPGRLDNSPPFVAPHQPRLDWQMWFAALGTYSQNPWLVSLSYRLLSGEKTVTQLLDKRSPWMDTPPSYIRAVKYIYRFTPLNETTSNWWTRKLEGEYMPVFSVDHKPLLDYLRKLSLIGKTDPGLTFKQLATGLDVIRNCACIVEPHLLIWSIFVTALLIIFTKERWTP